MPDKSQEIYFIIILGVILGLLLVGFIVTMLFLYQRRQQRAEREMRHLKDQYEREALRSQLEIQENTFKTISQELHDNIGQMLSVVKISLSILPMEKEHPAQQAIENARQVLNKAIYDLSNLTKSLHTDRIADIGLTDAIRFELELLKKSGILQVQFSVTGEDFVFEEQKGIFLFRMFQEILNNILKHSRATAVIVDLIYSPGNNFVMAVEDNGLGFELPAADQPDPGSRGVGLKSMYNRARLIGARLEISSQPGKGTRVVVSLP